MISSEPIVKTYLCDGATTAFAFPYRFLSNDDILVQREDADGAVTVLESGDYTVTGAGEDAGGTVTTTDTYADGKIRVFLQLDCTQPATYANGDPFPAQSHEDALDRLTLLSAMRKEEFSRTIRSPLGRSGLELPPVDQMAGKLWASDSEGVLTFVPTVAGDDILTIDASSIYFDHNDDAAPRLVLDVAALGSTPGDDLPNPGGPAHATLMLQDDIPLTDTGLSRLWFGAVFRGQNDGTPTLTGKHSRYLMTLQARSQISAPLDGGSGDYLPQEVGCMNMVAWAAAGTSRAKVETLVISAREEEGLTEGSKGVAIQAITVRTTQGPDPDDRSQITNDEDSPTQPSDLTDPSDNTTRIGSFTLRINGGTVGGVLGGYRSWSGVLISGRAGYFNGVVLGKMHTSGVYTDPESVGGWGGVWGGRSFWHDGTFAVRCTDEKPGWIAGGKDEPDYPCDVVSATVSATAGRAYAVDGTPVVGTRKTGWAAATGTPLRTTFDASTVTTAQLAQRVKALIDDLIAHGLIGA